MSEPLVLPQPILEGLQGLFPTLNWPRIRFHLGFPTGTATNRAGYTERRATGGANIYINEDNYNPCFAETFALLAHELYHALQISSSLMFEQHWLYCTIKWAQTDGSNPVERPAFEYERELLDCLNEDFHGGTWWQANSPLDCREIVRTPNQTFAADLLTHCGHLVRRDAATPTCVDGLEWVPFVLVWLPLTLLITFVVKVWEVAVGFVKSITDWIFGKGSRPVKLMFSQNQGETWENNINLGLSGEPPSVTFRPGTDPSLYVAWTNRADYLEIFRLPDGAHTTFEVADDDSGPALKWVEHPDRVVWVAWQREDKRLYLRSLVEDYGDGANWLDPTNPIYEGPRRRIHAKVPNNGSAALEEANGRLYVAWFRRNHSNTIGLKSTNNGGRTWRQVRWFYWVGGKHGKPALAFINNRLYLAWTGKKTGNLYYMHFAIGPDGFITDVFNIFHHVRRFYFQSSKKAGPALAAGNGKVFLAWVEKRKGDRLAVARYDIKANGNLGLERKWTPGPRARKSAGPGLAYLDVAPTGLLAVTWIRKK